MAGKQEMEHMDPEKRRQLIELMGNKRKEQVKQEDKDDSRIKKLNRNQNAETYFKMSFAQERLFFIQELEKESSMYNISFACRIIGIFYSDILEKAIQLIIARHESLHTSFHYTSDGPKQVIYPEYRISPNRTDLSQYSGEKKEEYAKRIINTNLEQPFDLNKELIRIQLFKMDEQEYILSYVVHHIIFDGWSMSIFNQEVSEAYNFLCEGKGYGKEPLRIQYADYSEWQRSDLQGDKLERLLQYWRNKLSNDIAVTEILTDYKRPSILTGNGDIIRFRLDNGLTHKLRKLSLTEGCTINVSAMAVFVCLLYKYTRSRRLLLGMPVSNRDIAETEAMIGMFVNTLVICLDVEENLPFTGFLKRVRHTVLEALEYKELPFEQLIEALDITRDMSRSSLVQVLFDFMNMPKAKCGFSGTQVTDYLTDRNSAQTEISFFLEEHPEGIEGYVIYNKDLYNRSTVERMIEHYLNILTQVLDNKTIALGQIDMITAKERDTILEVFNQEGTAYPREKTITELFERQAERTPGNTALTFEQESITYEELNRRANCLAHKLRGLGVGADDFVAVFTQRSIEMIVGIYAVLKAGGAYVPINTFYPADRIRYILEDCKPKALLIYGDAPKKEIEQLNLNKEHIRVIDLADSTIFQEAADNPDRENTSGDLAYVIYTSGTTGKPKGVMVEHRNVVRLFYNDRALYDFNENDVWLMFHSYGFDFSVWEMYGAGLFGGRLVIPSYDAVRDSEAVSNIIKEQGVTVLNQVPSAFYELLKTNIHRERLKLRYLIFGGEALSPIRLLQWHQLHPEVKMINMYGITETTVHVTYREIREKEIYEGISNIGTPIPTLKVFIMDEDKLCPIGIPGELCVAGDGLARGYLNDTRLTEEKFIKNPFGEGRLYRSGDLARWLPDGNLEYLGRIDEQVKIRGFRIEAGEIENVLRRLEGIKDAVVIVREDASGDKALYAYLTADTKVDTVSLRRKLAGELPEYMIPAFMLQIEAIPVTENGKLNKRALPEIERKTGEEYAAPENAMEEILCDIFREILNVDEVGIRDSFFALGGDSIKAIRIVSRLRTHGYDLSVKDIMRGYTVETIAAQVKKAAEVKYEQKEVSGAVTPTPILRKFEEWKLKKPEHFNQAMMLKVDTEDEAVVRRALDALVKHHDMLRAVYRNGQIIIRESQAGRLYDFAVSDYREENSEEGKIEEGKIEEKKIEEECNRWQESMDLENGPLMKAVLFLTREGGRMFFCLHHLIVDGVSWRILFEDFENAVRQAENQNEITLPMKTASYREWSEALEEYRRSKKLAKEKAYWEKVISQIPEGRIEREEGRGKEERGKEGRGKEERGKEEKGREEKGREEGRGEEGRRERAGGEGNRRERNGRAGGEGNRRERNGRAGGEGDGREGNGRAEGEGAGGEGIGREGEGYGYVEAALSREATEQLLYEAGQAYHTEINDLLVCALGMGIKDLTGQKKVAVSLEGHGREEIHKKIETDRTVGWFTSIYPVVFKLKEDLGESIIEVKETLRGVPNHGIGYGLLEDELHREETELYFNYLGEISAGGRSSIYSCGRSSAEENRMPGSINVNAVVENGEFYFGIVYDRLSCSEKNMRRLAELYKQRLLDIMEYCVNQEEDILTLSDFAQDLVPDDFEAITELI